MQHIAEVINGSDFRRMIVGAYNAFLREHENINRLNIFPVPDGDTGTNMLLTLGAVTRAVTEAPDLGIGPLSKRAADSAIMGARGNSGVILAQIFRGIARGLAGKEHADSSVIGKAFQYGVLYAYRAVARPVEGTILTVSKGIAKGARRAVRDNVPFVEMLAEAINAGQAELARTPELLPALKEAGVVDAGGMGLLVFLRGCMEGLMGSCTSPEADFDQALTYPAHEAELDVSRPYCTEFIVKPCSIGFKEAKAQLLPLGDSLVISEGEQLLKVHIHTAHPGAVLEAAVAWGTLHDIKIDNMADQHHHKFTALQASKARAAVISVAPGEGLARIMTELGASIIIQGGQTMNPPVEDFVDAVHSGLADRYIILPNNKNIVLAAMQVKKLLGEKVEIVPTVNVQQGLAALTAFMPEQELDLNVERMAERIKSVKAASITTAVRDSVVAGESVSAGSYLGIVGNDIALSASGLPETLQRLADLIIEPGAEVISLYYGGGLTEAEAQDFADMLAGWYPDMAVELYYGGQPHYQLIISVE